MTSQIDHNVKLDFQDVLVVPRSSSVVSRKDVELQSLVETKSGVSFYGIPIIASNMHGVGTIEMAKALYHAGMFTCLTKDLSMKSLFNKLPDVNPLLYQHIIPTLGLRELKYLEERNLLFSLKVPVICLDVANGYMELFAEYIEKVRENVGSGTCIIAGNVVTSEGVELLAHAGADIVKIGIGSGSLCTTRAKTGVGYPQLSALLDCYETAQQHNVAIISDGGCTCPGDIVKAFAAGADFVMLGGMLAGHVEGGSSEGDVLIYGSSSEQAMITNYGSMDSYRTSEGREVTIPHRGKVLETVLDILGGLRSGMSYIGARSIKEIHTRARLVRVNHQLNTIFEK